MTERQLIACILYKVYYVWQNISIYIDVIFR